MTHTEIVSFIWNVANLIRDSFKRGKYQDVIHPADRPETARLRARTHQGRLCLARNSELRDRGLEDRRQAAGKRASGFAFYNTSHYDFDRLLADAPQVAANLRNYIAGFSGNMREVVERFDFDNTISKLDEAGLLFQVLERFRKVDLHPDEVDNPTMGTIFEELIRRFNESLDENPGEHFTPRDVVHLMVDLMLAGDEERISGSGVVRSVCDPCCGSGGMLMIAKEHILRGRSTNGSALRPAINPGAEIHLFGQEVNPETWALSEIRLFHEGSDRARPEEHRLRQHALQRPACRPPLRLFDRQPALRQGLEARQGRGHGGARTRGRLAGSARGSRGSVTADPSSSSTCWRGPRHRRMAGHVSRSS